MSGDEGEPSDNAMSSASDQGLNADDTNDLSLVESDEGVPSVNAMPFASDHGLDQTPSSEKKHEAGDSTQSVPLKNVSGTIEWRGPIEYLAGFSSPANLGVTCFLNVVLVAMYQRFRNNPNAWIPIGSGARNSEDIENHGHATMRCG